MTNHSWWVDILDSIGACCPKSQIAKLKNVSYRRANETSGDGIGLLVLYLLLHNLHPPHPRLSDTQSNADNWYTTVARQVNNRHFSVSGISVLAFISSCFSTDLSLTESSQTSITVGWTLNWVKMSRNPSANLDNKVYVGDLGMYKYFLKVFAIDWDLSFWSHCF